MTRKALGRGLDALLATNKKKETEEKPEPGLGQAGDAIPGKDEGPGRVVPVDQIEPNPDQPRGAMDQEALESLAASISAQGVLQPLLVTEKEDGGYFLIAGERRWQAAQLAGLKEVPVTVREAASDQRLVLALIENVQRQDLNVLEEASAYRRLMDEFGLTQEKVAQAVGRDRATVANLVRLLNLPLAVQSDVLEDRLSMGHARALLALKENPELLLKARNMVLAQGLSVRKTESLVEQLKKPVPAKRPSKAAVQLTAEEESLRRELGTKVSISKKGKKGRIVIEFYSDDELNSLISKIKGR